MWPFTKANSVNKANLIRSLAITRVTRCPESTSPLESEQYIKELNDLALLSLPDATIVVIVESYVSMRKKGIEDINIYKAIESHRSMAYPSAGLPNELTLMNYVKYRTQLEADWPISDRFIEFAVKACHEAYTK